MEDAHWPSEKCKSKPQCDITSCSLGCQILKTSKQKQQKIMIVGKDVEKLELKYAVGCNWFNYYGKMKWKKLKIELWFSISSSEYIYSKELKSESQRGIYTFLFTAALFTVTKDRDNPNVHQQLNA